MMRFFLLLLIGFSVTSVKAQPQTTLYPQQYFRWPLNITPEIVANLGEIRTNHWHMGLDIRTQQAVNKTVVAAADGYIARVSVQPLGYGRCIYINHPNGLTTVYGHLNDFNPQLEAYIKEQQYTQESWAIDITLAAEKFPVKKGEFIAYSGTTGSSQGPHVHFEIRNTASQECLNPLLFNMPLTDKVKPSIVRLALYDRQQSSYLSRPQLHSLKTVNGELTTATGIIKTGLDKVSFGIQAFDRISGSNNQDGIYAARLYVNDQLHLSFYIDSLDYNDTRYMNAHIDYPYKYNGGAAIQLLSQLPGEKSGVYRQHLSNGVLSLDSDDPYAIRIETEDAYKNITVLNFQLQKDLKFAGSSSSSKPALPLLPNQVNIIDEPAFYAYFPETAFYDTVPGFYYSTAATVANAISATHQVNDMSIPVHNYFTVRIMPDKPIAAEDRDRILIRNYFRNTISSVKANWEGKWLSGEFRNLGNYVAVVDKTAPFIPELGNGDTINLSASNRISFTPTDNYEVKSFRAELNGKWLRFTNDKGKTWSYIFDEQCPLGVHHLKVTVEDLAGNITTKEWWFKRETYSPPVKKTPVKKAPAKKAPVRKKK